MKRNLDIVMIGATGAVGGEVVKSLLKRSAVKNLCLLGRRRVERISSKRVEQHVVDLLQPETYMPFLYGKETAICTVGVGEPSKVSRETLVAIDKNLVLTFAKACKEAGVKHFQLLSAVAASTRSKSFFLRNKGELHKELRILGFERFSIFQPCVILTPENRYGLSQAVILKIWPILSKIMVGPWTKFRGISASRLGFAISQNAFLESSGAEILHWNEFDALCKIRF